jgi:hypothetical protein
LAETRLVAVGGQTTNEFREAGNAVMAFRFSGALQVTDLDDFITPSQVKDGCNLGRELIMSVLHLTEMFVFTGMH